MTEFVFNTRTRIWVHGFSIEAGLIGKSLTFTDEGMLTKLILPPVEAVSPSGFDHPIASLAAHRRNGDVMEPLTYRIHAVEVELYPVESFDFADDPYADSERDRMHEISRAHHHRSKGAVSTFFQVARWQAKRSDIGRATKVTSDAAISLVSRDDGRSLYVDGSMLTYNLTSQVAVSEWGDIARALKDGARPPIYWDLLLEGEWLVHTGDLRRATVDLAMACELFIQTKILRSLPKKLAWSVRQLVGKANAGAQRDKLFAETLTPSQLTVWKEIKGHITGIAERRNQLVHQGTGDLSYSQLREDADHIMKLLGLD